MSHIHGFNDIKKDDKPKGQGYFSGGEKGGVEFYANDDASKDFKQAEQYAQNNNTNQYHSADKKDKILNIEMFGNGFTVDGQFRSYEVPENKKFIDDVKEGFIPAEYQELSKTTNISINLTNKTTEQFNQTTGKAPVNTFSGEGMKLGSVGNGYSAGNDVPVLNPEKPTANVKVRFIDGKSKVLKVNQDISVKQLYALIAKESNTNQFKLMGIPNKLIEPSDTSIKEAKLCNTSLIQSK
ncbi:SEP domain-containing protein [Entamoeba marina]